jgi:hypothetical protein
MKNIIINNISTSYFITKDGKCYNSNTGKYLKGQKNYKNGYISYNLTMPNGKKTRQYAHRLVAIAYLKKEDERKNQVNHIDGNKENNCVDNLEWVDCKENMRHAWENHLYPSLHVYCFNKNKELIAEYQSIAEAARAVNISYTTIQQALNQEIASLSGGFYWRKTPKLENVKNYDNLGKTKTVYQYSLDGKFINKYSSTGEASRSLGLKSSSHIGECCRGKIKTYKGFIWRYAKDIVSPSIEK